MPFLREGLDKVMLTVRHKSLDDFPYRKDIAKKYADRITRLKFGDRWGNAILFESHPWQTIERHGKFHTSYATKYLLRIDGMRQMRVLLNCQRLYNIQNNLKLYDKRLFDDNVVVPTVKYSMHEFVEMVQKEIRVIMDDYIALRKEVFKEDIIIPDLIVDTHQIEMVQEAIGVHTSDLSESFKRHSRAETITIYHEGTNTHYFKTSARRQLKMYQKGTGICRLEATFNERPGDIVWDWQPGSSERIAESLHTEFITLLSQMDIPWDWHTVRVMEKNTFIWKLADAIGLREKPKKDDEGPPEVLADLMKVLLNIKSWKSDSKNEDHTALTRRLRNKGLIVSSVYGTYVPTKRLMFLQEIYQTICETEGWLC